MFRRSFSIAAVLLLGACASITRGTEEGVVFDSDPPGAEMRSQIINICAEGGCENQADERYAPIIIEHKNEPGPACITPCTIQIKRNVELLVTFAKPGYHPQTAKLSHAISAGGGAGVAGNIIAGGLTGIVVDTATGAGLDHHPNPMKVTLVPIAAPTVERTKRKR